MALSLRGTRSVSWDPTAGEAPQLTWLYLCEAPACEVGPHKGAAPHFAWLYLSARLGQNDCEVGPHGGGSSTLRMSHKCYAL